jgi:hypothetical protein
MCAVLDLEKYKFHFFTINEKLYEEYLGRPIVYFSSKYTYESSVKYAIMKYNIIFHNDIQYEVCNNEI